MRHSNYFIVDVGRSIQGRDRKTIRKPSIERIRAIDHELIAQQALTEPIEENNPYRQFVPSVDLTDNDNYRRRYNLNDVIQPNVNYPAYKAYSIGSDDILKKANDNYDAALANTIAVKANSIPGFTAQTLPDTIPDEDYYDILNNINATVPESFTIPMHRNIRIYENQPSATIEMRKAYGDKKEYPKYYVPYRDVTLGIPFTRSIGLTDYISRLKDKQNNEHNNRK